MDENIATGIIELSKPGHPAPKIGAEYPPNDIKLPSDEIYAEASRRYKARPHVVGLDPDPHEAFFRGAQWMHERLTSQSIGATPGSDPAVLRRWAEINRKADLPQTALRLDEAADTIETLADQLHRAIGKIVALGGEW